MKYLTEFREKDLILALSEKIHKAGLKQMKIMEVCGSQTHTIMKYNLEELLPEEITLVHGPGCPVCVTPAELIDKALFLAKMDDTIILTFGDMIRVPGTHKDMASLNADGADIRIIYSPLDAVKIARQNPDKNVILFAIGFETTVPANASAVIIAAGLGLKNFYLLSAQVLIPPAVEYILSSNNLILDGLLAPGHVCSITGYKWCEKFSDKYKIPITVTGFEPADLLEGILLTVESVIASEPKTKNQYRRIVKINGNIKAQDTINEVFKVTGRNWRGLGFIPESGYMLNEKYSAFDAEKVFNPRTEFFEENNECIAGEIMKGVKKPGDCSLFGNKCQPLHPAGAPMVSSEGACSAYYKYRKINQ